MHPILFEIPLFGGIPIYSYGVMLGTSFIAAWYLVMAIGKRDGLREEVLANAFIVAALSALTGARVLYVITMPGEFFGNDESAWETFVGLIDVRRGGLVAYGGFLGGYFGAHYYLHKAGVPLLRFADVAAPTLALGLGLTRIGCYLFGCDFGAPLSEDAPAWLRGWGTFPHWENDEGSPAWAHHVDAYNLDFDAHYSLPVHPTQLYESAAGVILAGICLFVWTRRQFHGQVLFILTALYGIWRFLIEFVRDDPERGEMFGFSTSQLISLLLVPLAIFFYLQRQKLQRERPVEVYQLGGPLGTPMADPSPARPASKDGWKRLEEEDQKDTKEPSKSAPPRKPGAGKPKKKK